MDNNKKIVFNAEMSISYPTGFGRVDDEVKRMMGIPLDEPVEVITDPDRHMTMIISQRQMNLAERLNGVKDLLKVAEPEVEKEMEPCGYKFGSEAQLKIDGEMSAKFDYEYKAEDMDMFGETVVIKRNKIMYTIHLFARKKLKEASLAVWNEILDGIRWV